jgi:hypothetical protein
MASLLGSGWRVVQDPAHPVFADRSEFDKRGVLAAPSTTHATAKKTFNPEIFLFHRKGQPETQARAAPNAAVAQPGFVQRKRLALREATHRPVNHLALVRVPLDGLLASF